MIKVKRVYDNPVPDDGVRYLVDRIWPRGMKKDRIRIDGWLKDIAPSDSLRRWFSHDPDKWNEFRVRYFKELEDKPDICGYLLDRASSNDITLLFGAKDVSHNNAVALAEFLKSRE